MSYETKQRKCLLQILKNHPDETLSVDQIVLFAGSNDVSASTVYRNLSLLEKKGVVKRLSLPCSQKAGFRYVGASECRKHLHLECTRCGRTFHLALPVSDTIIGDVMRDSGFQVDGATTILSGLCVDCRKT